MSMGGMNCPECGVRLSNEDEMRRHKEEMHGGGEKEEIEKPMEKKGG